MRPFRPVSVAHTALVTALVTAPVTALVTSIGLASAVRLHAQQPARAFTVDRDRSHIFVVVHRAGLLSFLGHEHAVVPTAWSAQLCLGDPIDRGSHGSLTLETGSLLIDTDPARTLAGLGAGPSAADRATLQEKLLDSTRLDARGHAEITLAVDSVSTTRGRGLVGFARLTLRGITRAVTVPIRRAGTDARPEFSGVLTVRQTDYGITPESKAGVVKVADPVDLHFLLVAVATDRRCGPRPG